MDETAFSRMMSPVMRRVRLMLGRGVVSSVNDGLKAQNVQLQTLGEDSPDEVERLMNYGQISVPLPGAEAITGNIGAQSDSVVALIVDDRRYRPTGLVGGDTGVYHFEGHRIRLTKDGRCIITCKTLEIHADESVTIDTPKTTITGDVEIQGAQKVIKNITAPNAVLSGISTVGHTHKGDSGGNTGPMK